MVSSVVIFASPNKMALNFQRMRATGPSAAPAFFKGPFALACVTFSSSCNWLMRAWTLLY